MLSGSVKRNPNSRSSIRHDREHPRRKTRAAFRLRETDNHDGARLRHLVQVRQQLYLVMVSAEHVRLQGEIILRGRKTRIGIGGLMTARGDLALFVQIFQRLLPQPG